MTSVCQRVQQDAQCLENLDKQEDLFRSMKMGQFEKIMEKSVKKEILDKSVMPWTIKVHSALPHCSFHLLR